MLISENQKNPDLEKILEKITALESRISHLEAMQDSENSVKIIPEANPQNNQEDFIDLKFGLPIPVEHKFGEYGLAWLGNIVLFFAIAFLWQYFNNLGKPLVSALIGYFSVTAIFVTSYYYKKSLSYLSFTSSLFGFLLLYYVTLRLHYYTDNPLISNKISVTILLLLTVGIQVYLAVKKKSQTFMGLAVVMSIATAYISDTTHLFFVILIISATGVIYLFWKYSWWKILIISLILIYVAYLVWLLKSPAILTSSDELTYYCAFIYISITTALFSILVFKPQNKTYPDDVIITSVIIAGLSYAILLFLLVVMHFPKSFIFFFLPIAIYCIIYSVLLKFYSPWKYSPALFALVGFMAISISIYGIYHFPDSFLLLTWQSFLVLICALWYRSKIITLMNSFLLVMIILAYYKLSGKSDLTNFSIPLVAFLSARFTNWQKDRLNIKTDLIRNIYLIILFFSFLVATYKALPNNYITISWVSITLLYFVLSIVLKNTKYRFMALANLIITAFYLFWVDLANVDMLFRIIAFLLFAALTIGISIYYVKKVNKKDEVR